MRDAAEGQRTRQRRMAHRQLQRDVAAVAVSAEKGLGQPERAAKRQHVLGHRAVAQLPHRVHRPPVPAQVQREDAELLREDQHVISPAGRAGGAAVQENQRLTRACHLVVHLQAIGLDERARWLRVLRWLWRPWRPRLRLWLHRLSPSS